MEMRRNWQTKCLVLAVMLICSCSGLNSYQKQGDLRLAGLETPVTVMRDEKGMAYIYAGNLDDAIMEMINYDGPVLFDCLVEKHENCFPMIPSGKAHNEMLLGEDVSDEEVGSAIDKEGKIVRTIVGYDEEKREQLDKTIAELVEGKTVTVESDGCLPPVEGHPARIGYGAWLDHGKVPAVGGAKGIAGEHVLDVGEQ